jgi:FKBP-type peptidyl-prolyl cis-trans isomerase SlyD
MQVDINTVVSIRYKMLNGKGEELENILEGSPVKYLHGSGNILTALETDLVGLQAGDEKLVLMTKSTGFEEINDDYSFQVFVDEVRAATEEEIIKGCPLEKEHLEVCGPECVC